MVKKQQQRSQSVVRILNTDIDGNKHTLYGLAEIHGVSISVANAILHLASIPKTKRIADLEESEIEKLEELFAKATQILPEWMLNRRKDFETGENQHLYSADLTFSKEKDVRRLRKLKTYRGFRHQAGAPMRGQRTRSNFRKNKTKGSGGRKR
jgi:small subunit ribosomal protein S13